MEDELTKNQKFRSEDERIRSADERIKLEDKRIKFEDERINLEKLINKKDIKIKELGLEIGKLFKDLEEKSAQVRELRNKSKLIVRDVPLVEKENEIYKKQITTLTQLLNDVKKEKKEKSIEVQRLVIFF